MIEKYIVSARWWNDELKNRFGEQYSEHYLSDEEVIFVIIRYGRASITVPENKGFRNIEFQNDYD